MIYTDGCPKCLVEGGTGMPGIVWTTETRWQHRDRDNCTEDQLARAKPCRDVVHEVSCLYVPGPTYENFVGPCECNHEWYHPDDKPKPLEEAGSGYAPPKGWAKEDA